MRKIVLPPFHRLQQQVHDSKARFKVLVAGRRFGKSKMALFECLDRAINFGQDVWFVFPTYNNLATHWRAAKRMVGELPLYKNEQQHYMEFEGIGGKPGTLTFKSGDRPANLRGSGLDFAVIDEAAFTPEDLWYDVIRPSLSDRAGEALLISTPNGVQNWFYRVYNLGLDPLEPDWQSWCFPTVLNPYIPKGEVDKARRELPDLKFRQEYLAEFVSDAAGVFRSLQEQAVLSPLTVPIEGHNYVFGVDWGRKNDYTVINIWDQDTAEQVAIVRFTEIGFNVQKARLITEAEKWQPRRIIAEANAISMAVVEQLQDELDNIEPVYMTNPVKNDLVEHYSVGIERGYLKLLSPESCPEAQIQISEMQAYAMQFTRGGRVTYNAPRGYHDDTVVSGMLAVKNIVYKPVAKRLIGSPNPFYH